MTGEHSIGSVRIDFDRLAEYVCTACGDRGTSDPDHLACLWENHGRETLMPTDSMMGQLAIFGHGLREVGASIMEAAERAGAWILARPLVLVAWLLLAGVVVWHESGTDGLWALVTLIVGAVWLGRMLRRR